MNSLAAEQQSSYLGRIGVPDVGAVGGETLAALQLAHLQAVPFENLDVHNGRPIVLDDSAIYQKVVERNRGGYCYELNSLFARLLRTIGFEVSLLSARVARAQGGYGEEFDHLTLLVSADAGLEPHLIDVGFGDAFTAPIPLVDGATQDDWGKRVRLRLLDAGRTWLYEEDRGNGWRPQYRFTTTPHPLGDFAERNVWQQTSPESHFTQQSVCTLLTATGRKTVAGTRLIVTELSGERTERQLSPTEVAAVLADEFGISQHALGSTPAAESPRY